MTDVLRLISARLPSSTLHIMSLEPAKEETKRADTLPLASGDKILASAQLFLILHQDIVGVAAEQRRTCKSVAGPPSSCLRFTVTCTGRHAIGGHLG